MQAATPGPRWWIWHVLKTPPHQLESRLLEGACKARNSAPLSCLGAEGGQKAQFGIRVSMRGELLSEWNISIKPSVPTHQCRQRALLSQRARLGHLLLIQWHSSTGHGCSFSGFLWWSVEKKYILLEVATLLLLILLRQKFLDCSPWRQSCSAHSPLPVRTIIT